MGWYRLGVTLLARGAPARNIGAVTLFGTYISFQFLVTQYLQTLNWSRRPWSPSNAPPPRTRLLPTCGAEDRITGPRPCRICGGTRAAAC